jgi:hypothetical protein
VKWTRGQDTVDGLLAEGRLELVTGAEADGTSWLVSAQALLESAKRETDANPEAAYVLAYDAARKASTALLAQQGLRTKSTGHHVTVEQMVRASSVAPSMGSAHCAGDDPRSSTRGVQATTSKPPRRQPRSPQPR